MKCPLPNWEGRVVYVIGGGPSLEGFDFTVLKDKRTIGCNHAFRLGSSICKVLCFGDDDSFWSTNHQELCQSGIPVVTNLPSLRWGYKEKGEPNRIHPSSIDWLHWFPRVKHGLSNGEGLCWNYNTGAMAIHLALKLGAHLVCLLGFDLCPRGGKNNWHEYGPSPRTSDVYQRHKEGLRSLAKALPVAYPRRAVVQLLSPNSQPSGIFPVEFLDEHFGEKVCHEPPN